MGRMYNPGHPGFTFRDDVLPALGLSVTEAARQLGVSRVALSRVLNGRASISVDLARRLERWLYSEEKGGGPSAESILLGQLDHDLWQAEHSGRELDVKSVYSLGYKPADAVTAP